MNSNISTKTTASTEQAAQNKVRLNKFIAMGGLSSRRKADDLIAAGAVQVNGKTIKEMGLTINPLTDDVIVSGVKLDGIPKRVYYILNKPAGYICANSTQFGDKLITELLPEGKLSTVGRLDKNTEGLLIATNDGDFLNKIAHPSHNCEKEYEISINRIVKKEEIDQLRNGVEIEVDRIQNGISVTEKYFSKPKKVEIKKNDGKPTLIHMVIEEGKKRQIRLMMEKIGYRFMNLKRIRIGELTLGDLKVGTYRDLTTEEINSLLS